MKKVQETFEEYLRTHKDIIEKAYLVNENSLHYAILLKQDTFENQAKIIAFKIQYDTTLKSKLYPFILSFPPKRNLTQTSQFKEILL